MDEGKLLWLVEPEVALRPPRQGVRFAAEKKRKATAAETVKAEKRRKAEAAAAVDTPRDPLVEEKSDLEDEAPSELILMYNTVRGYVSTIEELWAWQRA